MAKKILKIIGVVAIVVAVLAVSLGLTQKQETPTEKIRYFGTIKTISCTEVIEGYGNSGIYQYLGYDTDTKCMFYVYFRPNDWSFSTTPYTIQAEDGTVRQAVYGYDYK